MTWGYRNRIVPASWCDWPEERPLAWHALASLEQLTRFASVIENTGDVVLLYHSVGGVSGTDYQWDLPVSVFREHISQLSARYDLVDLATVATTRDQSRKRVAVTFDDGFRNIYENALPILDDFEVPATIFVCPAYLDDKNVAQLRRRHNLPDSARNVVMTIEQLRDIADSDRYSVGNHSLSHPDLTNFSDPEMVKQEILGGKERLESLLGVSVDSFSYPYGASDDYVQSVARDAHNIVVTSEPRLVEERDRPTTIPRIDACLPAATVGFEATDLSATLRKIVRSIATRRR